MVQHSFSVSSSGHINHSGVPICNANLFFILQTYKGPLENTATIKSIGSHAWCY